MSEQASLAASMSGLGIATPRKAGGPGRDPVANAWDQDSSSEEVDGGPLSTTSSTLSPQQSRDYPRAPPPTPATMSPQIPSTDWSKFRTISGALHEADEDDSSDHGVATRSRGAGPGRTDKRPEKSTAVASRLIAAGLGVKAPRRTEEQREYDRAMKVQEKRRREKEVEDAKKQKADLERAKKAIWDD